ncbi:PH domain-containing protein [Amycolatopsis saalfeldensis]|uniref:PH domain-containing protein n=1 Tax=Amycolatopsis saalfeldensis TaxID=394193 RepID=A0A1H8YIG9_9PSEU|nr:PH domain-containing protein [Amycolatopsis saalfeldensis]SEP51936.1 PH domain-containing protein [Amycolatopsis saalfeldensis]
MDNYPTSWAPRRSLVVLAWSVAALLLVGAVTDLVFGDGKGAVLLGVAMLAVGGFAVHWSLVRPRLAVDAEGLVARTLGGTHRLPWAGTTTQLRTTRRMGRDGVTLELEHGDQLYVFGRLDLGEDPRDVMDVLSALRR